MAAWDVDNHTALQCADAVEQLAHWETSCGTAINTPDPKETRFESSDGHDRIKSTNTLAQRLYSVSRVQYDVSTLRS